MISIVVIALLLSAVGGATYSWFTDSKTAEIVTNTASVDYEQVLYYDGVKMNGNAIEAGDTSIGHTLKVEVTNNGTMPVLFSSEFIAERYSAYAATGYIEYKGDYVMSDDGNLTVDNTKSWSSGFFKNNLEAFQVNVGSGFQSIGTSADGYKPEIDRVYATGMSLPDGSGSSFDANVKYNQWSISNGDTSLMPGEKLTLSFELRYDGESSTYKSDYTPTIRFVSSCTQIDRYAPVTMVADSSGKATGTVTVRESDTGFVFSNGKDKVVIGWDVIDIRNSIGNILTVTIENGAGVKTVVVSGYCDFRIGGRISYQLDMGAISMIVPMSIPMTVWKDGTSTLVSFSDSCFYLTHSVSYVAATSGGTP